MNYNIKIFIFNYKHDENAKRWYNLLSPFFVCDIYDTGSSSEPLFKKFPNIYYSGLFNEAKKNIVSTSYEWIGIICSDVTITEDNATKLIEKIKWLSTTYNIGQYQPSIDIFSAKRNRHRDITKKFQSVNFIEGMFTLIKRDVIDFCPLINLSDNPYGLYIDNIISAIAIDKGLLNIIDNTIEIHHPEECGYDKSNRDKYIKWCQNIKEQLLNKKVSLDNLSGLDFKPVDDPNIIYKVTPQKILAINPYIQKICTLSDNRPFIPFFSEQERFIITLTSWPKRIGNIPTVIGSILNGDCLPDKIVINLAEEEFPKKNESLPIAVQSFIEKNKGLIEITWLKYNTKVWKKLLPTLLKYPNDCIISIDDDFIYPKDFLKTFKSKYLVAKAPLSGANNKCRYYHNALQHCGTGSLDKFEWYGSFLANLSSECFSRIGDDDFYTYCLYRQKNEEIFVGKEYNINMENYSNENGFSKSMNFLRNDITSFLDSLPLTAINYEQHHHSEIITYKTENKIPIFVSFTTWKDRICFLPQFIDNIKKQTLQIDKCFLWLSKDEIEFDDIPEIVKNDNFVQILWVKENLKSFKKFLTIEQCPWAYNIIIDDDRLYGQDILKQLFDFSLSTPQNGPSSFYCDICNSKGEPWGEVQNDNTGIKWINDSCVIYPPYTFPSEVFYYFDRIMQSKALISDECFIMPFLIHKNIKIYPIYDGLKGLKELDKKAPIINGSDNSALHKKFYATNGKNDTYLNKKNILIREIINELPVCFSKSYEKQFINFTIKQFFLKIYSTYYKPEQEKRIEQNSKVIGYNTNNPEFSDNMLNKYWSEYIVMKNIWKKGKQSDYIGFDQYDVHFPYNDIEKVLSADKVLFYAKMNVSSIKRQFTACHTSMEMDAAIDILNSQYGKGNKYSDYLNNGTVFYYKSCFVMSWANYDKLCKFLFGVLDALDKRYGLDFNPDKYKAFYEKRIADGAYKGKTLNSFTGQCRGFGFLAERLLSAWLWVNIPHENIITVKDGEYKKHINNSDTKKVEPSKQTAQQTSVQKKVLPKPTVVKRKPVNKNGMGQMIMKSLYGRY